MRVFVIRLANMSSGMVAWDVGLELQMDRPWDRRTFEHLENGHLGDIWRGARVVSGADTWQQKAHCEKIPVLGTGILILGPHLRIWPP